MFFFVRLCSAQGCSGCQDDCGLLREGCCRIWAVSDLTGESSLFLQNELSQIKQNLNRISSLHVWLECLFWSSPNAGCESD